MKKHKLYMIHFTAVHWVKPIFQAAPIFLIMTSLVGGGGEAACGPSRVVVNVTTVISLVFIVVLQTQKNFRRL